MSVSNISSLERWSRLGELIKMLNMAESIEEAVETIRFSARSIAGADGITIVLREDDMVHYIAEDAVGPLWTGQRFPADSCISGIAMRTGAPVVIPNVFLDDRVPHEAYRPTFVNSMAMFPVGVAEPIAAIGAYWSRPGEADGETIDLLTTLARSAAAIFDALDAIDYVGRKVAYLNGGVSLPGLARPAR